MRSKGPIAIAENPDRKPGANAALPITAAALQSQQPKNTIRLKLVVRRLPPGLTEPEFLDAIGDEWTVGKGKVDWFRYHQGKLKSAAKNPTQSRAYLRVTTESHIKPFEATFLSATFQDAKGTHKDPNLTNLLPIVSFAPSQRVPNARQRADNRQGTIDQDPEFQSFLASLTEPIVKPLPVDTAKPREKVTTTPLIQSIREKKSSRAKAAANKATGKPPKDAKSADERGPLKGKAASQADPKSGRKAVKASDGSGKADHKPVKAAAQGVAAATSSPLARPRKREQAPQNIGNVIRRDLGILPKRGIKSAAAAPESVVPLADGRAIKTPDVVSVTKQSKNEATAIRSTDGKAGQEPSAPPNAPTGPKRDRTPVVKGSQARPASRTDAQPAQDTSNSTKSTGAKVSKTIPPQSNTSTKSGTSREPTKAFLKHANASQGITHDLLTAELVKYGDVRNVAIDGRKSSAIVEFVKPESLNAVIAQKRIPVAEGAVEASVYREKSTVQNNRGGTARRGGGSVRGGRGGSNSTAPAVVSPVTKSPAPTVPQPPVPENMT